MQVFLDRISAGITRKVWYFIMMKKKLMTLAAVCCAAVMAFGACGNSEGGDPAETETPKGLADREAIYNEMMDGIEEKVTLGEYKGLDAQASPVDITDEDVETAVQQQLEAQATTEQIKEGTVASGDTINLDYTGKVDGEEFDGGSATGASLEIGSGTFIPGFEDQLVGMEIGSTKDINVTFPDPYENNTDLSGKAAVFTVTVNYKEGEQIVPELNDEFVTGLGIDGVTTVDQFREHVRSSLEESAQQSRNQEIYNSVQEKVRANCTINEWASDLDKEKTIQEEKDYMQQMADSYGYSFEEVISMYYNGMTEEEYEKMLEEEVDDYFDLIMIYRAIAHKEGFNLTQEEYEAAVAEYSADYQSYGCESVEEFEGLYSKEIFQTSIYNMVEELLINEAKVTDVVPTEAPAETAAPETSAAPETTEAAE